MKRGDWHIRAMEPGEEKEACLLVREVFHGSVAPLYSQEGIDEFLRYVDPDLMAKRAAVNHLTLIAECEGDLVGLIEVRDFNHVSLLFVASGCQGKGIGKQLFHEAMQIIRGNKARPYEVTVHSSPNAVTAYERLGFCAEGGEKVEHGIRYIPMKLFLGDDDDG
jgi:GNAT superfamily N-acetyltransferase